MGRGISILIILAALTVVSVSSQQARPVQQPVESHVVPLKKISKSGMDKRFETVSGGPTKAGAPFVIRIHAEAGYIIMPHTHPEDENIVVVKGSWALGMGDRFKRDGLEPMEVGDYGFVPNGTLRALKDIHDYSGAWNWAFHDSMDRARVRTHR